MPALLLELVVGWALNKAYDKLTKKEEKCRDKVMKAHPKKQVKEKHKMAVVKDRLKKVKLARQAFNELSE